MTGQGKEKVLWGDGKACGSPTPKTGQTPGKKTTSGNPGIFSGRGYFLKLYDKNAVAKFLDMTPKNVQRLTEKGILKPSRGSLYSLTEANHAYIKYLRDSGTEDGQGLDYTEERARLVKAKRINEELDVAVKKGELHRADDVRRIMAATLINFKSRLSAIPAEEAEKLATMTDRAKIFIYLTGRIKEALDELSDFGEVFREDIKEDGEEDS